MDKKYIVAFILSGIVIILLWALTLLVPFLFLNYPFSGFDPGTFGDMFGSVNALFSGLAFAGFLVTMWMQYDELKLQREDNQKSRDEFEKQAIALKEANDLVRLESQNKLRPFIWIAGLDYIQSRYPTLFFILRPTNHPFRIINIDLFFYSHTVSIVDHGGNSLIIDGSWHIPEEDFSNSDQIETNDYVFGIQINDLVEGDFENDRLILNGYIKLIIQDLSGNYYRCKVYEDFNELEPCFIIRQIRPLLGNTVYEFYSGRETLNFDYLKLEYLDPPTSRLSPEA